MRNFTL